MRLAVRALRASLRGNLVGEVLCRSSTATNSALPRAALRQPVFSPASTRLSLFSTTATHREEATATVLQGDSGADGVVPIEETPKRAIPERDSTFASLKPHISYPTFKALTVKPFAYKEMSDVQQRVLHLLPDLSEPTGTPMSDGDGGRDMLVKARTGTGKTIAFLVPAIERRMKAIYEAERGRLTEPFNKLLLSHRPDFDFAALDKHGRQALARQFATNTVGTLILSPTRELATQIANEAIKLHHFHEKAGVNLLVGGAPKMKQLSDWKRGRPDVVVATPGRIADIIESEPMVAKAMSAVQTLVLDEADTLLEMGFRDEIQKIISFLPAASQRTTMLFSATVSKEIRQIARKSLEPNHRFIDCVPEGEDNVHKHIPQFATVLDNVGDQMAHIVRLIAMDQLQNAGKSKVIVFAPTTRMTQMLSELLNAKEVKASLPTGLKSRMYEIHSKKDQGVRFRVSDRFRTDKSGASVLITSDVSARGVDYPGTTRVIQVGIPSNKDQYIHRIGRTGRAGAGGRADIVLQPFEAAFLHEDLRDLPVQEHSVSQLKTELNELAFKFDEDPLSVVEESVWKQMSKGGLSGSRDFSVMKRGKGRVFDREPSNAVSPLLPNQVAKVDQIETATAETIQAMDEEGIRETFFSMLGFYVGHAPTLRQNKSTIADSLKAWTVEALGLQSEPYISANMADKLGITGGGGRGGGGNSRYGRGGGRDGGAGGGFSRFGRSGDRDGYSGGRGRGGYSSGRSFDGGDRGGYGGGRSFDGGDRGGRFSGRGSSRGGPHSEFSSPDRY